MALAEGRLTELPGVAMVTRGPGAANAFIAIHTAHQDATPMILFVGLIPVADRGRESFQEFDINAWFGSTAKKVVTLDDAASAARVVDDAIFTALSGRPGPVVIGLPEDVLVHAIESGTVEPRTVARTEPATADLAGLRDEAGRGQEAPDRGGRRRLGPGFLGRAGRLGRPPRRPRARGFPRLRRRPARQRRLRRLPRLRPQRRQRPPPRRCRPAASSSAASAPTCSPTATSADWTPSRSSSTPAPICWATSAGWTSTFPPTSTSFATALAATESAVEPVPGWLAGARADYEKFSTAQPDGGTDVDLAVVMEILKQEMDDDAVITYGAGNHSLWPARYLKHNTANSLAAPRNGAMGMGIPAAVAASLAYPGRQVISVAGDGCFLMNGQEMATAMGHGGKFIALVVDNGIFATIREHQEGHYPGRPSGTHMTNPDFAALARSYGGYGERVEKAEDFGAAFRRAVESGLPAVLHLPQDPATRSPKTASN